MAAFIRQRMGQHYRRYQTCGFYRLSALGVDFWQLASGALLLSIISIFQKTQLPMTWAHIRFYTIVALVGTIVPNTFTYIAAAHLPAGLLAIGIATVPMFAAHCRFTDQK